MYLTMSKLPHRSARVRTPDCHPRTGRRGGSAPGPRAPLTPLGTSAWLARGANQTSQREPAASPLPKRHPFMMLTRRESSFCGEAACPAGLAVCGAACVDLSADATNCGACGVVCVPGGVCSAGQCTIPCTVGATLCGSSCVDLRSSAYHCGACGVACPPGFETRQGSCRVGR